MYYAYSKFFMTVWLSHPQFIDSSGACQGVWIIPWIAFAVRSRCLTKSNNTIQSSLNQNMNTCMFHKYFLVILLHISCVSRFKAQNSLPHQYLHDENINTTVLLLHGSQQEGGGDMSIYAGPLNIIPRLACERWCLRCFSKSSATKSKTSWESPSLIYISYREVWWLCNRGTQWQCWARLPQLLWCILFSVALFQCVGTLWCAVHWLLVLMLFNSSHFLVVLLL